MSESFQQIDSRGNLSNKRQFLAAITSDKLVIHPYQAKAIVIRFYESAALITGTTDLQGTYNGTPFKTYYRYTDAYVKESDVWRIVNVQTTETSDCWAPDSVLDVVIYGWPIKLGAPKGQTTVQTLLSKVHGS